MLWLSALCCSIFSTLSCQWFAWTPLEDGSAWGVFDLDSDANQATSVGLFRYHPAGLVDDRGFQCRLYFVSGKSALLVSRDTDPWMFTAQLCWLLATLLACIASLSTATLLCRPLALRSPCCTKSGWLLASGLQASSCVAASSLCGGYDFWSCPWLQGAHASAAAGWFYLLCWLLSLCGYRWPSAQDLVPIAQQQYHGHNKIPDCHSSQDDERRAGRSIVSEHDVEAQQDDDSSETPPETAEELLGTNDPVIHQAVRDKAAAVREFAVRISMEDYDDEEDMEDAALYGAVESSSIATPKTQNVSTLDP